MIVKWPTTSRQDVPSDCHVDLEKNCKFKRFDGGKTRTGSELLMLELKVPKCENFHRTDFYNFNAIKPLWVGKNKKIKILIFRGSFGGFSFENFVLTLSVC